MKIENLNYYSMSLFLLPRISSSRHDSPSSKYQDCREYQYAQSQEYWDQRINGEKLHRGKVYCKGST